MSDVVFYHLMLMQLDRPLSMPCNKFKNYYNYQFYCALANRIWTVYILPEFPFNLLTNYRMTGGGIDYDGPSICADDFVCIFLKYISQQKFYDEPAS